MIHIGKYLFWVNWLDMKLILPSKDFNCVTTPTAEVYSNLCFQPCETAFPTALLLIHAYV